MDFTKWAWNENWVAVAQASSLVPRGADWETVDPEVVRTIARKVLVDNVRGQAPEWAANEIKFADLTMRRLSSSTFEYSGSVSMAGGSRGYDAKIYGQAKWNAGRSAFDALDIVAMGMRKGAARFNQRENDPGPAPMGITLSLRRK